MDTRMVTPSAGQFSSWVSGTFASDVDSVLGQESRPRQNDPIDRKMASAALRAVAIKFASPSLIQSILCERISSIAMSSQNSQREHDLLLARHRGYCLELVAIDAGTYRSSYLTPSSDQHLVLVAPQNASVVLAINDTDPDRYPSQLGTERRLGMLTSDHFYGDSSSEVWRIVAADPDCVLLRVSSPPCRSEIARYSTSGQLLGRVIGEDALRRVVWCELLMQLGSDDAFLILEQLSIDELPRVRWSAVRGMVAIDEKAAFAVLSYMSTSDSNAHVRSLATQALARRSLQTSNTRSEEAGSCGQ
jgi:hypothetical protein